MYPGRLLFVAFSVVAVTQASYIDPQIVQNDLARRQEETSASATAAPPPPATSSAVQPTTPPSPPTTRPNTPTTTPQESSTPPPETSTAPPSTSEPPEETTSAPPTTSETPIVSVITTVITTTGSDGAVTAITSEATTTSTPGLNGDGGSSDGGMTPQTRNIIIGCVAGIGGAIIIGALGFVAWRIWGRKRQAEENDGLMNYNAGYGGAPEKAETPVSNSTGRTPFQSTLETYHAPTNVNASSNF